jgi:TonB family protein
MPIDLSKTLTPLEPLINAVPEEKRRLGLFIFLAATLHFVAFTFIQVRYPTPFLPAVSGLHLIFDISNPLNPTTQTTLSAWSSLLDPSALIVSRDPLIDRNDFKITPQPLIQKPANDHSPAVGLARDLQFLPDHAAPLVDRVKAAFNPPLKKPLERASVSLPARPETVLELSSSLQGRLPNPGPVLPRPVAGSLTEAGVTLLRIGVDQDGRVQYALVEKSSGKSATDDLGMAALRRVRFESVSEPGITWGQATIYWQFQGDSVPTPAPADKL